MLPLNKLVFVSDIHLAQLFHSFNLHFISLIFPVQSIHSFITAWKRASLSLSLPVYVCGPYIRFTIPPSRVCSPKDTHTHTHVIHRTHSGWNMLITFQTIESVLINWMPTNSKLIGLVRNAHTHIHSNRSYVRRPWYNHRHYIILLNPHPHPISIELIQFYSKRSNDEMNYAVCAQASEQIANGNGYSYGCLYTFVHVCFLPDVIKTKSHSLSFMMESSTHPTSYCSVSFLQCTQTHNIQFQRVLNDIASSARMHPFAHSNGCRSFSLSFSDSPTSTPPLSLPERVPTLISFQKEFQVTKYKNLF